MRVPPALRHRDFRILLVGYVLTQGGDYVKLVVQNWPAWELTQSPLLLGVMGLCEFGPRHERLLTGSRVYLGGGDLCRRDRFSVGGSRARCAGAPTCGLGTLAIPWGMRERADSRVSAER